MDAIDLARATWRKSSRSSANSACVEVAHVGDVVALRDSKNPAAMHLVTSVGRWRRFVSSAGTADCDSVSF